MLALSVPVDCVPLTARLPLQPPLAAQEVALVAVQPSVAALPEVIEDGLAASATVGAAAVAVTVALCVGGPPGPVQVSVYD